MVKQNSIHGPLRNNLSKKSHKPLNGYIIFYKFYKKILDKEYPKSTSQSIAVIAGRRWRELPNDLKNSFIQFANTERLLQNIRPQFATRLIINSHHHHKSRLRVIFDDRCCESFKSSNEITSEEDSEYCRIFNEFIDLDACF
ncbi:hypothetical protein RhiirA1_447525 [Rhizophagus irregularis]|uniref:HMG box domain-containing protein n=3 Tax=Rhizophagus irregularis TaxID=588596 RepID=U9TPZ2_RHIID|nr:hypothetical protein GLOIN_2v1786755 [Rhizophagus irregularis DAOM 181602=DAOM 197198]EXX73941.1 hypothetical protein RirG_055690 [Rhizophagus irregularis DAOM 197198w]PKC76473.1 hypothetical protein RhiirA1_447525 [Rhizophagus irregularis]PKY16268.1 hypothetical protein RhiirB3_428607 [Rhizophagus irregularis]POG61327.1 hypothetical protein GLOIN_2v1786755 [Rhizophagus irregularis DAOM 181602=DAOM 197198]UZO21724.1 hypothetical protein OCT59_014111 [Rhizophagus irregularis]|eukprot:XP_025168193.1 hypothetical protein GLOIN_2v1786755 [Rhizophagus irregularis DAOM 181602=DAOM 197198]